MIGKSWPLILMDIVRRDSVRPMGYFGSDILNKELEPEVSTGFEFEYLRYFLAYRFPTSCRSSLVIFCVK